MTSKRRRPSRSPARPPSNSTEPKVKAYPVPPIAGQRAEVQLTLDGGERDIDDAEIKQEHELRGA
jgi:hypothetical protein